MSPLSSIPDDSDEVLLLKHSCLAENLERHYNTYSRQSQLKSECRFIHLKNFWSTSDPHRGTSPNSSKVTGTRRTYHLNDGRSEDMKSIYQLCIGSIPSERPSPHDIDPCVWLSIIRDNICRTTFLRNRVKSYKYSNQ